MSNSREEEIDNVSLNDEESSGNSINSNSNSGSNMKEHLIGSQCSRKHREESSGDTRSWFRSFVEKVKKPGRYALGVGFIFLVVAIWVSSSGLIQYVFSSSEGHTAFKKPFFITYASTSLFTIYLSGFLCLKWRLRGSHKGRHPKLLLSNAAEHGGGVLFATSNDVDATGSDSKRAATRASMLSMNVVQDSVPEIVIDRSPPTTRRGVLQRTSNGTSSDALSHSGSQLSHSSHVVHHHSTTTTHIGNNGNNSINSLSYASSAPSVINHHHHSSSSSLSSTSLSPLSSTSSNVNNIDNQSSLVDTKLQQQTSSNIGNVTGDARQQEEEEVEPPPMTTFEVCRFALQFAPIWFIANVTFNWSLSMTSVSSSSVISSTSGLFTFLIGVMLGQAVFRWIKLLGIALSIGGVVLIAINDRDPMQTERFDGDLLCLFSAVMYACYANFLQRGIKDERRVSMAMFFGFVGMWNLITIWPGFVALDLLGWEKFEWPSAQVAGFLVLNGLIGTVLSDWLWVQSMLLTTPLISTLGLSLTIPAALLFDWFRGKSFSLLYFAGASLVLAGFVTTTVAEHRLKAKAAAAAAAVAHANTQK